MNNKKKLAFEEEYKHYSNQAVIDALKWEWFDGEKYNFNCDINFKIIEKSVNIYVK